MIEAEKNVPQGPETKMLKRSNQDEAVIVRRLLLSDLGLFGAARPRVAGKQRAIQMNARVVEELLTSDELSAQGIQVRCTSLDGRKDSALRPLSKSHKNWRLGGDKITDPVYDAVSEHDLFVGLWTRHSNGAVTLQWRVLTASADLSEHSAAEKVFQVHSKDSMLVAKSGEAAFSQFTAYLRAEIHGIENGNPDGEASAPRKDSDDGVREPHAPRPVSRAPSARKHVHSVSQPTVKQKVTSPHILPEMLRVSSELSAPAQVDFLELFALYGDDLRRILLEAGAIKTVQRNHADLWKSVQGQIIASIDGGMAGMPALGSAPLAIRAGAYLVRPGDRTKDREKFLVVRQLVDEIYEIFNGAFPDTGALRDAARISLEAAAALQVGRDHPEIDTLIMHGALVNPVSRYSDDVNSNVAFPNFSAETLRSLLPDEDPPATGRDANFIAVHLRQIQALAALPFTVCSVVERESAAQSVTRALLETVIEDEHVLRATGEDKSSWSHRFLVDFFDTHRIADSLLFRCVLNPGEYLHLVPINRNDPSKAPRPWMTEVASYPLPLVSYFLPSSRMAPVRVEIFDKDRERFDHLVRFLMHCSWLLPGYAFPVSLDIADKFAKVPAWMARSVQEQSAAQVLRRAIETGQPEVVSAARRLLTGGVRDWLFRPGI